MNKKQKNTLIVGIVIILLVGAYIFRDKIKIAPQAMYGTNIDYLKGKCSNANNYGAFIWNCGSFYCLDSMSGQCKSAYTECAVSNIPPVCQCGYTCSVGGGGTPNPFDVIDATRDCDNKGGVLVDRGCNFNENSITYTPVISGKNCCKIKTCEEGAFGNSYCKEGQPYRKLMLDGCKETEYQIDICTSTEKCENGKCVSTIIQPPPPKIICGDSICDLTESSLNCPQDCQELPPVICYEGDKQQTRCNDDNVIITAICQSNQWQPTQNKCEEVKRLSLIVWITTIAFFSAIGFGIWYFGIRKKRRRW